MKLRHLALPVLIVGCHGSRSDDSDSREQSNPNSPSSNFVTVCKKPNEEEAKTIRVLRKGNESCEEARVRLAGLKELDLSFTGPGNPITGHVELIENPDKSRITDISVLKEFTKLERLNLNGQRVQVMTVLSHLSNLVELNIQSNPVKEISVPGSLVKFDVTDTGLSDYKFLNSSGKLKYLYGVKETLVDTAVIIIPNTKVVVFNDKGISQTGFSLDGIHKDTGTAFGPDHLAVDRSPYDSEGFDWEGFNNRQFKRNGENKNGTRFGANHLTLDGQQFYNGRDYQGFDLNGFSESGDHKNGTRFGANHLTFDGQQFYNGRDYQGYDVRGFNQSGIYRDGSYYAPSGANLFGFSQNGTDLEGQDSVDANQFRKQKTIEHIAELTGWGFPFYDLFGGDAPVNLEEIKEILDGMVGHGLVALPSDQQIYNDLVKLKIYVNSIRGYNLSLGSLVHEDSALLSSGRVLDFTQLWADLNIPNDDWYVEFFNILDAGNHYAQVDFPDETDNPLNGNQAIKRDYLIIFLASIKDPGSMRELSTAVRANPGVHIGFPTGGNSASWFAEIRYRLYHVYQKRNELSQDDIKTLIGMFMHGGKHCSDAKKDQVKTALGLFNNAVETALELRIRDLATTLKEKIQYVASKEKTDILKNRVDSAYNSVVNDGNLALVHNGQSAAYVRSESITYKAATWDYYAPLLGLPLNESNFPGYRLIIQGSLTDNGAYSPTRLYNKVNSDLGQLIKDDFAGSMQFVINYYDKLVIGSLIKEGFVRN